MAEGKPTGEIPEGVSREVEATPEERTRESEIRDNFEFWQSQDVPGLVKPEEQEVRKAVEALPEKEGYDWIIVIPKGIESWQAWQHVMGVYNRDLDLTFEMPREPNETYAVAARYSQEPDKDSVGRKAKSAKDWEETGETFMTPIELVVAEGRWHAENKTHLNKRNITLCPGSRTESGNVPYLETLRQSVPPDEFMRSQKTVEDVLLKSYAPEKRHRLLGVRRVVTAESKPEK